MIDEIDKIRKKVRKEFDDIIEVDEDSDLPVHEKFTKEKKIKRLKGFNALKY